MARPLGVVALAGVIWRGEGVIGVSVIELVLDDNLTSTSTLSSPRRLRCSSMLDLDDVVLAVCRLPIDYRLSRWRSATELVRRAGASERRAEVSVERIAACLRANPDWVDAWFEWSADAMGTPAWYVAPAGSGEFVVGYVVGATNRRVLVRDDRVAACAEYVRRYLDGFD
jgi:hypothetical protein